MKRANRKVVKKAILTPEEQREIREDFRLLEKVNQYWDTHAGEIHRRYGGQWVALAPSGILAHARTSAALGRKLRAMGARARHRVIKWVPLPDQEYVFALR